MDKSRFLAKALGIYLLIVGLSMILNMQHFIRILNSLIHNEPLMFVTGFFTLILGVLFVLSHNIWQWNWRVIITIIAWITLIKGASILLYPQFINKTTILFMYSPTSSYITASIDVVLGILLCYFGFRSHKQV
jgi:cytochrome bd-type quinol oxidase subunit 2